MMDECKGEVTTWKSIYYTGRRESNTNKRVLWFRIADKNLKVVKNLRDNKIRLMRANNLNSAPTWVFG